MPDESNSSVDFKTGGNGGVLNNDFCGRIAVLMAGAVNFNVRVL